MDGGVAEDRLDVPGTVPIEMGVLTSAPPAGPRLQLLPMPAARNSSATTRSCLDRAARHARQARAGIDVLHVVGARVSCGSRRGSAAPAARAAGASGTGWLQEISGSAASSSRRPSMSMK